MKVYKILSLLAVPVCFALSSCTEKAEYSSAGTPVTASVYFPVTDATEIMLAENQSSVKVNVSRVKTDGPLTVALVSSETLPGAEEEASSDANGSESKLRKLYADASGKVFTIPSTVTFEDGAETAGIEITFDFNDIIPDKEYIINLEVNDETSEYGSTTKQVTIKYAPWSDDFPEVPESDADADRISEEAWAEGGYTYTQMVSGTYYQAVFRRTSLVNPSKVEYCLLYWFYGVNLIIESDESQADPTTGYIPLTVKPQLSGYYASNYSEDVYVADSYTYWHDIRGEADVTPDMMPSYYDPAKGRFVLNLAYYISQGYFAYGEEYLQLDGFETADYSVTMTTAGTYTDESGDGGQLVNFVLGEDVASVSYAVVQGDLTDEEVKTNADAIHSEDLHSETTAESGVKVLPISAVGDYTLVAVSYDSEGGRQETSTLHFNYKPSSGGGIWEDRAIGTYTYIGFFGDYDEETDEDIPVDEEGMKLQQYTGDELKWRIPDWGLGTNFAFSFNEGDGSVTVDFQPIGYDHPTYGPVYVVDYYTWKQNPSYMSEYDDAEGTFWFVVSYVVLKDDGTILGSFWNGYESFTITDQAVKARVDAAYHAAKAKGNLGSFISNMKKHNELKFGPKKQKHLRPLVFDVTLKN